MHKEQALRRVAELSARIDKTELRLDGWKWERADAMLAAREAGATTAQIAEAAGGVKERTVRRHMQLSRAYGGQMVANRPRFLDAIEDLPGGSDMRGAQEAQARKTLANPESRRRILDSMPTEHVRQLAIETGVRNYREQDKHRPHPTPAERAQIHDETETMLAPFTQALSRFTLDDTVDGMRRAAADISQCLDNHGMTVAWLDQLEAAYGELTEAMLRARELADIQSL